MNPKTKAQRGGSVEVTDHFVHDHMLDCVINLPDNSNDFSLQSAKASHVVMLCKMEEGDMKHSNKDVKIDRI